MRRNACRYTYRSCTCSLGNGGNRHLDSCQHAYRAPYSVPSLPNTDENTHSNSSTRHGCRGDPHHPYSGQYCDATTLEESELKRGPSPGAFLRAHGVSSSVPTHGGNAVTR